MANIKKYWTLGIAFLLFALLGAGAIWYFMTPHTPAQYHERLQRRLGEVLPGDVQGFERMLGEYVETERLFDRKFPDSALRDDLAFEQCEIADRNIGDATRALAMYDEFAAAYPDSEFVPRAFYRIGEIRLKQKQYLKAVESFRDVVARFPEHELADDAQYQIGLIFSEIGEEALALKELRKVVEEYPESPLAPKAQLKLSDILSERMQNRREAVAELEKLQSIYGDSPEAAEAESMKKVIGQEVAEEEAGDYEREHYGAPLTDHTRSWQDDLDNALAKEIEDQGLDIEHYALHLEIAPDEKRLAVAGVMTFRSGAEARREFKIRLSSQMKIEQMARVNSPNLPEDLQTPSDGEPISAFKHDENLLAFRLDRESGPNEAISLFLKYSAQFAERGDWHGDQIEAASGFLRPESYWYPFTNWGDNATADLTIDLPDSLMAAGPGILAEESVLDGRRRIRWKAGRPFFGITLSYGRYVRASRNVQIGEREVPIDLYIEQERSGNAERILSEVEKIVQFYSERFCPYPYEALKLAEAPGFPGGYGACTLVLLHPSALEGSGMRWLLAHELSHQWWGNLVGVSLVGGSIPWLTEGFATYSDILYCEGTEPREALLRHLSKYAHLYYEQAAYGTDEPVRTVRWRSPMYQAVTYQKGSLVLHALRSIMGEKAFFAALKEYARRYSYQRPSVEDFRAVCEEYYRPEESSPGYPAGEGQSPSLQWFFDEWLDRPGFPILRIDSVDLSPAGAKYDAEITILQDEYVYQLPLDVEISGATDSLIRRVWILQPDLILDEQDLPWLPKEIVIDPEMWILKDPRAAYTRWSLRKG